MDTGRFQWTPGTVGAGWRCTGARTHDSEGIVPWIRPWGLSGPWGMTLWTQGTNWPTLGTPGNAAVRAAFGCRRRDRQKHCGGCMAQNGENITWFHCLFGSSQLRRLEPKRPRNTMKTGALPRATLRLWRRLPWATMTAPLQGACRFAAWDAGRARTLAGIWRRRGLKARTTAGRRARAWTLVALPLNSQSLTDYTEKVCGVGDILAVCFSQIILHGSHGDAGNGLRLYI